jgi:hypothetical protein
MPLVFYQAEPEYRIYAGAEGFSGRIVEKFQDGIVIKGSEHDMLTRVAAWLGGFVTETWANVVPDGYNSPEASEQGTSDPVEAAADTNAMYLPLSAVKCIARGNEFKGLCKNISTSKTEAAQEIAHLNQTIWKAFSKQSESTTVLPVVVDRGARKDSDQVMRFSVHFDEAQSCDDDPAASAQSSTVKYLENIAAALSRCPLPDGAQQLALRVSAFHSSSGTDASNEAIVLRRLRCAVNHFINSMERSRVASLTTNYAIETGASWNFQQGQYDDMPESYDTAVGFLNRRIDIAASPPCKTTSADG